MVRLRVIEDYAHENNIPFSSLNGAVALKNTKNVIIKDV